jgi:nucleoid-associated protein YgaU
LQKQILELQKLLHKTKFKEERNQEAGMTTRPKALIQAACISLLLILVPGTASPQEQKEPTAPQVEKPKQAVEQAPPQQPGTLILPKEKPDEESPAVPAEAVPPAPVQEKSTEYIIRKGDTLWDIANSFYRDPFLWPFIWKANPYVANADLIYPGNKLLIPSLAPIERAMEEPKERVAKAGEAAARPRRPKPTAETEEEAPAEVSRLILPEEKPQPLVDA